jgi:hypothetical protein
MATDLGQRHTHGNDFLKDKKDVTETFEGGDLYSALPKI